MEDVGRSNEHHVVDVAFPLLGSEIPADHAGEVFAAVSRVVPALHGAEDVGLFPVRGLHLPGRRLLLTDTSELRIRLPSDRVGETLPLAGRRLRIGRHDASLGTPSIRLLRPASVLQSRLVTIKGFMEAEAFLEAVQRQMASLACQGTPTIPALRHATAMEGGASRPEGAPLRRTLAIHGREIVGFALRVSALSDRDSLRLQAKGIGGRRRYGCGLFTEIPEE